MKKSTHEKYYTFIFFTFLLSQAVAQSFQAQNVSLLSSWFDSTIVAEPIYGIKYNGVWGWDDGNGKEYAIIGSADGTYIIEVTNPSAPVVRDYVPGLHTSCIWREYKTYGNYLYMVSDDGAPNGLQIADLSYLPDSVSIVHSSDSIIMCSHTIFIDGDKLYAAGPSGGTVGWAAMAVYSLANPEAPQLLRAVGQDVPAITSVHDMLVRNDTIYASCAYQGLYILKLLPNNTFSLLQSLTSYPDQGYNHSSALTDNGETLIFCDEVPDGMAVKSLDVSDFSNLQINQTFKSNNGATPHNPFALGNDFVAIAYYKDGLRIFNISDPSNVVPTGYFDTYWQNDSCACYNETPFAYAGSWGAYPYLPSGNMIVSDMQNGFYLLDPTAALTGISNPVEPSEMISVYPNPATDDLLMVFETGEPQQASYTLTDVAGKIILSEKILLSYGKTESRLNLESLNAGVYILNITGKRFSQSQKVIKTF